MKCLMVFFFLAFNLQASFVVISDIDDTIRPSHVHDKSSAVFNLLKYESFYGVDQVYQELMKNGGKFFYVTGFPLKKEASKYLRKTGFPFTENVYSKPIFDDMVKFKLKKHLDIILSHKGRDFIVIGDNGQVDIEVFAKLDQKLEDMVSRAELAEKPKLTSIVHQVYEGHEFLDLKEGQLPYLTYFDLSMIFLKQGYLTSDQFDSLNSRLFFEIKHPKKHLSTLLPNWVQCSKYTTWFMNEDYFTGRASDLELEVFENFLLNQC